MPYCYRYGSHVYTASPSSGFKTTATAMDSRRLPPQNRSLYLVYPPHESSRQHHELVLSYMY